MPRAISDTHGFSIDDHRDMWGWRDWVIASFLKNQRYDQFLTEQLAGDLIPGTTPDQIAATGFLRNSMNTHEGGTIPEEYRVIDLFQSGGPSHIDLFDYKPMLEAMHGTDLPDSVRQGQRLTGMTSGQKNLPVCKNLKKFAQHGQSGQWISEFLPHISQVADRISVIRSMHTEAINHDPAITFINTGSQFPGFPSMGSWVSYGLGSMNRNLPAYVVLTSQGTGKNPGQPIFSRLWGSGFLPSSHQGVQFRSGKDPVLFLNDPAGVTRGDRREMLDDLAGLNHLRHGNMGDPEILARITDLARRGLLEDTLVIWGGEFGRTVYSQGELGSGRDHHGRCFSMWVAGGGIKPGLSYGTTDDYSYNIVENPVHIRDLNATILHCLGMDHDRFTFRFQGLNQKPTGVLPAKVVTGILA